MTDSLFTAFRRIFPEPSRVFLERPDGTTLSYGDLLDLSGRVAEVLVELGVRPGDRVAAQVEKSAETLMLYLGTLRAGAVYLPLNTAYTAAEARYFLGDAEPALFVCRPALCESLAGIAAEIGVRNVETLGERQDGSLMQRVFPASLRFEDVPRGDLAAILYTSGTIGRSKEAMLTHRNLASNAQ